MLYVIMSNILHRRVKVILIESNFIGENQLAGIMVVLNPKNTLCGPRYKIIYLPGTEVFSINRFLGSTSHVN